MMKRFSFFTNLCAMMALTVSAADVTEVTLTKPRMRWLWGGFGFHNSEATMTPLMSDAFRDQRVLKTFREIAPTYSRVFAGFADWTREAMDSFADYYDLTFRGAGTTIYMVPGRFPYVDREFDAKKHFEDIAKNCAYLVKERRLTKLRYYAVANELSAGNVYAWFSKAGKLDLYRDCCEEMYLAFRRHGLDIGLQTADASGTGIGISNTVWATRNVDEFTDTYCWHVYDGVHKPGDLGLYASSIRTWRDWCAWPRAVKSGCRWASTGSRAVRYAATPCMTMAATPSETPKTSRVRPSPAPRWALRR